MKYENRLVLFLDILGFANEIDQSSKEGVLAEEKIQNIHDAIKAVNGFTAQIDLGESKEVTQFSDSIVLSVKIDDDAITNYFQHLLQLVYILFSYDFLCRGAISYGQLIHKSDILFGPALVDAYYTESKAALYPRVIIDEGIIRMLRKKADSSRLTIHLGDPILGRDTDDKFYLDYFTGFVSSVHGKVDVIPMITKLRKVIIDGRRSRKPDVKIKYDWMRNKFNTFLNAVPEIAYNQEAYSGIYATIQDKIKPIP